MDNNIDAFHGHRAPSSQEASSVAWSPSTHQPPSSQTALSTPPTATHPKPGGMDQTTDMQVTPHKRPEYLDYVPTPHSATDRSSYCYRACLDRLGFKPEDEHDATEVRLQFIRDLRSHICVPETMLLRKEDNPAAFEALLHGFLTTYGPVYWGSNSRNHLVVSDPSKGFLHPRDSRRVNSRLVKVMEDLLNQKARTSRVNDNHRPDRGKRPVLSGLNLAALDPKTVNQLGKTLGQAEVNKLEKAPLGIEAAFKEIDKMRESMEVQSYASSEGDPEFYDEFGQERQPTKTRNISHNRLTRANHTLEAETDLPQLEQAVATRAGSRKQRNISYEEEEVEPHHSRRSKAKKRRGFFTSGAVAARKSRAPLRSEPSPILTDPDHGSTHETPRDALSATAQDTAQDTAQETACTPLVAEPKTPLSPSLPTDISSKVFLVVIASNQQTLAPVTVNLNTYTSAHEGFRHFIEFLAQECELGDLSKNVAGISATYTWSGRRHRLRKDKIEADGNVFFDHVAGAFEEHAEFAKKGCEVEMMLHVAL